MMHFAQLSLLTQQNTCYCTCHMDAISFLYADIKIEISCFYDLLEKDTNDTFQNLLVVAHHAVLSQLHVMKQQVWVLVVI